MKKTACLLLALLLSMTMLSAFADRSTIPTFTDGELGYNSFTVSGIVWKHMPNIYDTGRTTTINRTLSSYDIEAAVRNGGSYGINYKITVRGLRSARNYHAEFVFVDPLGTEFSLSGSMELSPRYTYSWYDCLGYQYFPALYDYYGYIPSGTYRVMLYLNSMLTNVQYINVY